MKIKDNTTNKIAFTDIKVGEVFKFKGGYYMKTTNILDLDDETKFNAVNLNGDHTYFNPIDFCEKVNATLTIDKI